MRRKLFAIAVLTMGAALASPTPLAHADDCPRYLILTPLPNGQANCVQAHEYAYGWFGAGRYSASTWHRTWSGTGIRWTYYPGY